MNFCALLVPVILLEQYNYVTSFSLGHISHYRQATGVHWKNDAITKKCGVVAFRLKCIENEPSEDANDDDEMDQSFYFDKEIKERISRQPPSSQGDRATDSEASVPLPETNAVSQMISEQEEASFRKQERELLHGLLDGDFVVPKLRELWFSERGPEMEAQLYVADACIGKGTPEDWTKAELILLDLAAKDATFLEPFVRLSKLYTLQGRFADSHQICLALVEVRPWHYVVLETMVVNTMVFEHNQDLKAWASKRLPAPSLVEKRSIWVKQAIADSIRLEAESLMERKRRQQGEGNNEEEEPGLGTDTPRRESSESQDWQ
ncbi:MAG: hypothetical protein SGBAC_011775 [Bacillariaceae sp.]